MFLFYFDRVKEELQRRLFLELINLPGIFLNNPYNIRKQMKRQNLNFLKPKVTLWWTCCFHFRQSLNMSSYEGVFNCHVWFYAPVPLIQDEFLPRGDDRVTLNLTDTNYHQSTTKIFNFSKAWRKKSSTFEKQKPSNACLKNYIDYQSSNIYHIFWHFP